MSKFIRSKVRKSNRLRGYDYSQNGEYFTTICVDGMKERLGKIIDGEMILNRCGEIVKKCLLEIPKHFPDIELDEYQVMPNHIHGVINIYSNNDSVGTRHALSLQSRKYQKLSVIIGSFKSASSKLIHQSGLNDFKWQRSFYDRIIDTDDELDRIRDYIISNPSKWDEDRNNPKNLKTI